MKNLRQRRYQENVLTCDGAEKCLVEEEGAQDGTTFVLSESAALPQLKVRVKMAARG